MNNVHDIREAKSAEHQATEWVALLAGGDASAEDRARFEAWLKEHPGHQAAFDEVDRTWSRLLAVGDQIRGTVPVELDARELARSFVAPTAERRRRTLPVWTAAAAAAAVTIGGLLLYPFDKSTAYRTEVGQQTSVTLPDESTLELNTDTELTVAYTDRARRIELHRGEAYFDVAHDADRPFVVAAGQGAIRAVGTGFVVRVQNQAVKVTVTEGVVEVTHDRADGAVAAPVADPGTATPGRSSEPLPARSPSPSSGGLPGRSSATSSAQLTEGQRVEYDENVVAVAALSPEELDRDLAWRQGLVVFDGQTLEQVVREVGRYTDTRLIIADVDLRDMRVGGAFRAGDLEAVLEFFEKGLNVSVNRDAPRTIYLTSAPAAQDD